MPMSKTQLLVSGALKSAKSSYYFTNRRVSFTDYETPFMGITN